jgi:hypothetical protein
MEKVTEFKEFVKKNPILLKYIKSNEMTWQKFYEIFDMYGEEETAWKDYITPEEKVEAAATAATTGFALGDMLSWLKGLNLDSVQEGIQSLQRVVGVIGDVSNKKTPSTDPEYKPRPLYKHFDD